MKPTTFLLFCVAILGCLGPAIYNIALAPELTQAQMMRTFWWAYAIGIGAFVWGGYRQLSTRE